MIAYMTVDDLIMLGILNNLADLLDCTINVGANTTDEDNIFSRSITCLSSGFE